MIYINVWVIENGAEVTIGNTNTSVDKDNYYSHQILKTFNDEIKANVYAQELFNILSKELGDKVVINTL